MLGDTPGWCQTGARFLFPIKTLETHKLLFDPLPQLGVFVRIGTYDKPTFFNYHVPITTYEKGEGVGRGRERGREGERDEVRDREGKWGEWGGVGEERRAGREVRRERGEREDFVWYIPYTFIHFHIPLYTFIYLQIPPNTFIYLHIPPYTSKYPILGINIRHKNGHNSGPRPSPRARMLPVASYHVSRGFATPKGGQF